MRSARLAARGRFDPWATAHVGGRPHESSMNTSDATEHIAAERDLLRLLCSVLVKPVTRVELCRLVDPAKFVEPLQQVVFEEICALGTIDGRELLQLLPARVTNRW